MIDYLFFNNTKRNVYLLKNSIMYTSPKLGYGNFKMQQVLYIVYVILIPRYEYDIVVITRVRGEAEYEC